MLSLSQSCTIISLALLLKGLSILSPGGTWGIGSLLGPLIGFFMSPLNCTILICLRAGFSLISGASSTFFFPTLVGTLVLSTRSRLLPIIVPGVCMILFYANPVGSESMLYTLYWLIPMGIGLSAQSNIFLWSVASTFTTHAVGSVFYLYRYQTTSFFWHSLIPHVWYERMLYALLLTLSYSVITTIMSFISSKILHPKGHGCQNQLASL